MGDKKKDLIPVMAIALFLVIIIVLCIVRLNERRAEDNRENAASAESVEMIYASEMSGESEETSRDGSEDVSEAERRIALTAEKAGIRVMFVHTVQRDETTIAADERHKEGQ